MLIKKYIPLLLIIVFFSWIHLCRVAMASVDDLASPKPQVPQASGEIKEQNENFVFKILRAPTLPVSLLARYIEKTVLDPVEKTDFPKKFNSFWEGFLHNHGAYPEMRYSPGRIGLGGGAEVAMEELFKLKSSVPFLESSLMGGGTISGDYDLGGDLGLSKQWGPLFYSRGSYTYNHRGNETFCGIGPHSSDSAKANYVQNISLVKGQTGFFLSPALNIGSEVDYRHINIGNVSDKDAVQLRDRYTLNELPGRDGGDILTTGIYVVHDTRDVQDAPTQGGLHRFVFNFNRDTRHNDDYFKYILDLAHYFRLGSEKRVFVTNLHAEHAQDFHHSTVPFFDLSHIGDFGMYESAVHRGYDYNRFFDKSDIVMSFEYRFRIWEHRDLAADWIYFSDIGKVFGKLRAFGAGGMKVSYGGGFRLKIRKNVFFTLELAGSDEGVQFYLLTKTPF